MFNLTSLFFQLIKAPLEEMTEKEGPLLDNTELKTIFGHLPPIYHLHSRMLQELCWTNTHWTETTCIGSIVLKYVSIRLTLSNREFDARIS